MYITYICLFALLGMARAANLPYLPIQPARSVRQVLTLEPSTSRNTLAALRRIIRGHRERLQQADNEMFSHRALTRQTKELHLRKQPRLLQLGAYDSFVNALPPNTPTPKNYAQNYLPVGEDVVPGSSYIPLRFLLVR